LRRHPVTLLVGAIVLSAMACSGSSAGTGGPIEGTTWKLTSYDVGGTSTTVPADVFVDARFATGTVAGSSGCNIYGGPATVTGSALKVGQLTGTLIACEGPEADVETAYLAHLGTAASFTATADGLTIYDPDGKASLVYAAGPANPLIGEWVVTGFNNGKGGVNSPAVGTTLTATFTADSVSGSGGCNTFTGSYKLDGTNVTIGPLASTQMACEQAVMDQEAAFLAALQTPSTVEQGGANVSLRDATGSTQVTFGPK
jgi:heat shock protein HslJ